MVQDTRWPSKPLIALRGVQLFFSIVVLGLSAYIISVIDYWWACMALVSALFSLIYVGINFFLLFSGLLLPLAITITDAFLAVFWLISMAGAGDSGYLAVKDCQFIDLFSLYIWTSTLCQVSKAVFALSLLLMLLFIGSLVLAAVVLSKNRKDLRGAKYNSGMDPEGNPLPDHAGAAPVAPDTAVVGGVPPVPAQYYQDPPKNDYHQQSPTPQPYQTTTSPVYYTTTATQPMVSPPATPAPYSQDAGYPQAAVGSPPPPPPPVNAAEMPTR